MWVCFMCSMRASPPKKSLLQTGQLVALGPPIRAACCWNTTRCCNSFFGRETEETRTPAQIPPVYQKRRLGTKQNDTSQTRPRAATHYLISLGDGSWEESLQTFFLSIFLFFFSLSFLIRWKDLVEDFSSRL